MLMLLRIEVRFPAAKEKQFRFRLEMIRPLFLNFFLREMAIYFFYS